MQSVHSLSDKDDYQNASRSTCSPSLQDISDLKQVAANTSVQDVAVN